jgi:cytidyltransferase-like protein
MVEKKPTVVAISGAFDPIHLGHIRYINEAAKLGDKLVVILNSDKFLMRKKGFVFMPFAEREEILRSIKCVDDVIASIDEDQTVNKTLELLKPDIFAKGGNAINLNRIPEIPTCNMLGCKVVMHVGGEILHTDSELFLKFKDKLMEDYVKLKLNCPYCDDHPILREKCQYCKGTGKIEISRTE